MTGRIVGRIGWTRVYRWRWKLKPGMRKMQAVSQMNASRPLGTVTVVPCPGLVGGLFGRGGVEIQWWLSGELEVLERRLNFIQKATEKSHSHCHYVCELTFNSEYLYLVHCIMGNLEPMSTKRKVVLC